MPSDEPDPLPSDESGGERSCTYCSEGPMKPGRTTDVYERGDVTLVVKDIPALVCWACGESHVSEGVVGRLDEMLEEAKGTEVVVRTYAPVEPKD